MKTPFFLLIAAFSIACSVTAATRSGNTNSSENLTTEIPAPSERYIASRGLGAVRIREYPNTDSKELGYVKYGSLLRVAGDVVLVDNCIDCKYWVPVVWGNKVAWICAKWTTATWQIGKGK